MRWRHVPAGIAALAFCVLLGSCDLYDAKLLAGLSGQRDASSQPYIDLCGNGVLDADEKCDTEIGAGEEGACPTQCPADEGCRAFQQVGEKCQTECFELQITRAFSGDGCCPDGVGPDRDGDCGVCGDKIVSDLETCDPPEKCPTADACTARDPCLKAVFTGAAEACTASCRVTEIRLCQGGDACCPAGCSSASDSDCSASCGNHVLETGAGETCEVDDPSVPCPADCDDGIACTTDVMTGSVNNCNVTCSHIPVEAPVDGDGCCPTGENQVNDSDCVPVCGNEIVESGEQCDPCPSDCKDANACTSDSGSGSAAQCSLVCVNRPINAPASGDGCCPAGANANNDSDCAPVCGNGVVERGEACDGQAYCSSSCAQVLQTSIAHRYRFDGTGTAVTDSAGGVAGQIVGGSLSGSGTVVLSGGTSGPYVDLPNGTISSLTNATIEVWLTWGGGGPWQRAFDFGYNTNGEGNQGGTATSTWFVTVNSTNASSIRMVMNFTATDNDYTSDFVIEYTTPLSTNVRHQIAAVFDDANNALRLYVDGSLAGSRTDVTGHLANIDDRNAWIGRSNYDDADLNATVQEVRIYRAALSTAQVLSSYNAGPDP